MTGERHSDLPPIPMDYEPPRRVSPAEYERLEEQRAGRYEYHHGLMYPRFYPPGAHWAMAGCTEAHARISVRLLTALENHLGIGPCRVYLSDMKLKAGENDYYPDVFVVCHDPMRPNRTRLEDAVLICEVRSQSTAEFDTGDKFTAYTHLVSLRDYLILDNRRPQATLLHRDDEGAWRRLLIAEGGDVPLETVGLLLPLARVYEGITLDPDLASGR